MSTPSGIKIDDGHPITIDFADNPTIQFWEKTVTPPGIDGGGSNETTTMRNLKWRTFAPKHLRTLKEMKVTAAYDPAVYESILDMLQANQLISVNWPDGSTLSFWGWVDSFDPQEVSEGEQPEAEVTIIPSNQDETGAEADPSYTGPGT